MKGGSLDESENIKETHKLIDTDNTTNSTINKHTYINKKISVSVNFKIN